MPRIQLALEHIKQPTVIVRKPSAIRGTFIMGCRLYVSRVLQLSGWFVAPC